MQIKISLIILLSLYGFATTISMIAYIIKYHNCNKAISNSNFLKATNNCKNNTDISKISDDNYNMKKNMNNYQNNTNNNIDDNIYFKNNTYQDIMNSYDIYNNADFYDRYDLIDDFNDKIIIYSRDLKNCYISCENINNCYAFTKYNNYCYLKGKYDIQQKTNNSKSILIVKKNVVFNMTLPVLNTTMPELNTTIPELNTTIPELNTTIPVMNTTNLRS